MPELLTQTENAARQPRKLAGFIGMVAGFIPERWPASNRNAGRLRVGIPGRLQSESADVPPPRLVARFS